MSRGVSVVRICCLPLIVLAVVLVASAVGYSQPASQSDGIESFFAKLPGDWVGAVSETTDGMVGSAKYFHSVIKQLSPDIYESVFTYYRLDDKIGDPVLAGVSGTYRRYVAGKSCQSCTSCEFSSNS